MLLSRCRRICRQYSGSPVSGERSMMNTGIATIVEERILAAQQNHQRPEGGCQNCEEHEQEERRVFAECKEPISARLLQESNARRQPGAPRGYLSRREVTNVATDALSIVGFVCKRVDVAAKDGNLILCIDLVKRTDQNKIKRLFRLEFDLQRDLDYRL